MAGLGRLDNRFPRNFRALKRQLAALKAAYQLSGLFTQPGPGAEVCCWRLVQCERFNRPAFRLSRMRKPTDCGQVSDASRTGFRRKPDSIPMIADSL